MKSAIQVSAEVAINGLIYLKPLIKAAKKPFSAIFTDHRINRIIHETRASSVTVASVENSSAEYYVPGIPATYQYNDCDSVAKATDRHVRQF